MTPNFSLWYRNDPLFRHFVGISMGTDSAAEMAHPYPLLGRDPPRDWQLANIERKKCFLLTSSDTMQFLEYRGCLPIYCPGDCIGDGPSSDDGRKTDDGRRKKKIPD